MTPRTAHLILGVPRSGTSAVAQLLSDAGVHFGDPAHFLDTAVHRHNPNFFEFAWVNELDNLAIEALGVAYSDDCLPTEADFCLPEHDVLRRRIAEGVAAEFGDAARIGLKDPRFCFTFPLWRRALEEMGYAVSAVITLRSEVACRRSNLALEAKWADDRLWSRFYLQSLLASRYFTRDVPTTVIDYDRLMADPAGYAAGLGERLGLPADAVAAATAKLDPRLVHQRAGDAGDGLAARVQRSLRDGTLPATAYLDYRAVADLQGGTYLDHRRGLEPGAASPAPILLAVRLEMERMTAAMVDLNREADGLRLHAAQLGEVAAAKDKAVAHCQEFLADVERQRDALRVHADQLTAALAVKQSALEHHERHAAEMERQRDGLALHADQLSAVVAAKQTALEHHERLAAELDRQRDGLRLHAEQLSEVAAIKQAALDHHERLAADLQRQRDGLALHAEQLTEVVSVKQAALDHHTRLLSGASAEVAELRRHVDGLSDTAADLDRERSAARAETGRAEERLAVLAGVLDGVRRTRSWRWSAPLRRRAGAPLTEADLRPVGPGRFVAGCLPMGGRVRVDVQLSEPVAGPVRVSWDAGRGFDAERQADLTPGGDPRSFVADLNVADPAHGFRLDVPPGSAGEAVGISRARIFCVGRAAGDNRPPC